MRTRSFSWPGYSAALVARGLSPSDAQVLVRTARDFGAPFSGTEPMLPFLAARISPREFDIVLDAVIEAQSRGPRAEPWATAWRRLYVAGCPIEDTWRLLWHSLKDPAADPQDAKWLAMAPALDNIDRYIRLQFPRSGAPDVYGPGLGCERLLENSRAGARELIRLRGPSTFVLESLNLCRSVLSPKLRAAVDAAARVKGRTIPRPTEAMKKAVVAKVIAGKRLSSRESSLLSLIQRFRDGQDELLELAGAIEKTTERWFRALDELFAAGNVIHDVARDRFLLRGERVARRRVRTRPSPKAPRKPPDELEALLHRWAQSGSFNTTTVAELEHEDPLRWLRTVTEMAVFLGPDPNTGLPRIRAPQTSS